jgi:hypothetical protein
MSAEIIDLEAARRARRLRDAVGAANELLAAAPLPSPEELGWTVVARDDAGRPTKVFSASYRAIAGYVPGDPDLTFLDYQHTTRAYALSLEELLLGLESGILPEPVASVTS